MGGKRKFNKFAQRKRERKEQAANPQPKSDERKHYAEIVRENESFEKYYKTQNIMPSDEWETFMKKMKENLPTSFRITGSKGEAKALLDIVKGELFKEILNSKPNKDKETSNGDPVEDEEAKKPHCLPWYPGGLAWQLQLTRTDIRRSEAYYRLHNFLTAETNSGSISRQEAVSMIPPIVLQVEPHHKVLDMCASPGSKTAQLIEFLHADEGKIPTGFVMANDVDNNRCYMLVHQAKRLNSPCIFITNHDGAFLPHLRISSNYMDDNNDSSPSNLEINAESEKSSNSTETDSVNGSKTKVTTRLLKFDRILCDVPCSGDGTLRKNPDIWLKWSAGHGNNLHGVQYRIGHRGAELLKVGGRLTYSTCSLNPVENEAVISRLLREAKGALKLVQISHLLPGLVYANGMSNWKLATKDLEFFEKYEDVPEKYHTMLRPQMFPPTPEEAEQFHLDRCLRVLPHHQDTGGFFIAVLEKVASLPFEKKEKIDDETTPVKSLNSEESSAPWGPQRKRRRLGGYKEDPYVFFSGESEDVYPSIKEFYNLKNFDPACLLTRCHFGKKKNIYLVSPAVKDVVQKNEQQIKIINTGVKTFVRCDNKHMGCPFRLSQEGLPTILANISGDRKVILTKNDLSILLHSDNPHNPPPLELFSIETQAQVKDLSNGSCVLLYSEDGLKLELVGWRGAHSLRAYTARPDTVHMLRLLGEDVSKFDINKFKKADDSSMNVSESVDSASKDVEDCVESITKAGDLTRDQEKPEDIVVTV